MIEKNITLTRLLNMEGYSLNFELTISDGTETMGQITKVTEDRANGDASFDIYTNDPFLQGMPLTIEQADEFIVEEDKKTLTFYVNK